MRKLLLLFIVATMTLSCSKDSVNKKDDDYKKEQIAKAQKEKEEEEKQKEEEKRKEEEKQKEENKKDALLYFEIAKTNLKNKLNKTRNFDYCLNLIKALQASKGHPEVYKIIDDFHKKNTFATYKFYPKQYETLWAEFRKLESQKDIIKSHEHLYEFVQYYIRFKE